MLLRNWKRCTTPTGMVRCRFKENEPILFEIYLNRKLTHTTTVFFVSGFEGPNIDDMTLTVKNNEGQHTTIVIKKYSPTHYSDIYMGMTRSIKIYKYKLIDDSVITPVDGSCYSQREISSEPLFIQ